MQTFEIKEQEKKANNAVKLLRKAKHDKGLPFMIHSKSLSKNQCYLEYPDGSMVIVAVNSSSDRDFTIVRKLSGVETSKVLNLFFS